MQVTFHCLAFLALWTLYLLVSRRGGLRQALFFSGIFCLITRLSGLPPHQILPLPLPEEHLPLQVLVPLPGSRQGHLIGEDEDEGTARACQEKNIRLIPLVDGRQLGFINSLDLCALFGNAMDNAMEAVQELSEPQLREIQVRIGADRGLAMVCFRNYFDGQVKKQGERFLTRKGDGASHGYGLENIRRLAERYGGTAAYEIQGQEFPLVDAALEHHGDQYKQYFFIKALV